MSDRSINFCRVSCILTRLWWSSNQSETGIWVLLATNYDKTQGKALSVPSLTVQILYELPTWGPWTPWGPITWVFNLFRSRAKLHLSYRPNPAGHRHCRLQNLQGYTEWKGNKCHPFNSRRGRLKGPKNVYTIWGLNLIVSSGKKVLVVLFCSRRTAYIVVIIKRVYVYIFNK